MNGFDQLTLPREEQTKHVGGRKFRPQEIPPPSDDDC